MNNRMDRDIHLDQGEILDEDQEMNRRAEASEHDIASGRVKNAKRFKVEFKKWQKKKRADRDALRLILLGKS
jgi:hypothetical protein